MADTCSVGGDGGGHGVVAPDADDAPDCEPDEGAGGSRMHMIVAKMMSMSSLP